MEAIILIITVLTGQIILTRSLIYYSSLYRKCMYSSGYNLITNYIIQSLIFILIYKNIPFINILI
jgi:hypothetical protein